jgi:hypothetical protein
VTDFDHQASKFISIIRPGLPKKTGEKNLWYFTCLQTLFLNETLVFQAPANSPRKKIYFTTQVFTSQALSHEK